MKKALKFCVVFLTGMLMLVTTVATSAFGQNPQREVVFTLNANEVIYENEYALSQTLHQNRFACMTLDTITDKHTFVFNGQRIKTASEKDCIDHLDYVNPGEAKGYAFTCEENGRWYTGKNENGKRIRSIENLKSNIKVESLLPRIDIDSRNPFSVLPYDERTNTYSSKNTVYTAPYSKFIIPATLVAYGVTSQFDKSDDYEIHDEVIKNGIGAYTIDDYSQFAPAVAVYGLDLMGIKAKHNFRDRTIMMATSHLIMGGIVQTMKSSIHVERPDGSNYKSFPSGHTATAFVGAHILFKEYKATSPWIGVAGYAIAIGTGLLRVTNK
jgi:hypothetical protein